MISPGKLRIDQALVRRDLCESRETAQRLIRSGKVRVNGQPVTKPGQTFRDDICITLDKGKPYVSRGGEKLAAGLDHFQIQVANRTALDIGASTGGFTDCLLQRDVTHVIAVDVGKGQLHWNLRNHPRVTVLEKTNARYLQPANLDGEPDLAVLDVSFISLTKILPTVTSLVTPHADLVALIKPQFEAGRDKVQKGGVVKDPAVHDEVIERVRGFGVDELGLEWKGCCPSPLQGPAGNKEFLAWWKKR